MKTPVLGPLLNKIAGQKFCNFIKVSPAQVFSSAFCDIFKNTYFVEHLRKPGSVWTHLRPYKGADHVTIIVSQIS